MQISLRSLPTKLTGAIGSLRTSVGKEESERAVTNIG